MTKTIQLAVLAAFFSMLSTTSATPIPSQGLRQISRLYATLPGDPDHRVDPTPIRRAKAVLTRAEDGVSLVLSARELPPGAYTVWMRVFNVPELCSGGEGVEGSVCSRGSDLASGMDPSVPDTDGESTSSVFWLAGTIVGDDGVAHVSTSVETNEWPGMVLLGTDVAGTERQAVWDTLGAEIHIVMRYHGAAAAADGPIFLRDPETGLPNEITEEEEDAFFMLGRQLNRVLGNCSPFPPFDEDANNCSDVQLAVFPALRDRGR